ncbi:MAG: tetratricopeptide repeat protein [Myxococcales bacterium]|nr:tetratricopeptide repeat protein [Myxococcales bacterium]
MLRITSGLVGLVLWLGVAGASAQDADATAAARALFEEGVRFADRGDHDAAADRFDRALRLRWAPPIAYNLADALARLGRIVEASEHLHRVARSAEAPEPVKEAARARLDELTPRIARLRVHLRPSGEPGIELRVDGRPLLSSLHDVAFPIDPGARRVTAHRGEQEAGSVEVVLEPGAESSVELPLAPRLPTPEELARAEAERAEAAARDAERVAEVRARAERTRRRRLGGGLGAAGAVVVAAIVIGIAVAARPTAPQTVGDFDPPRLAGDVRGVQP